MMAADPILIVDDDVAAAEALLALLELDGYQGVAKTSSREAVELLGKQRFAAVITDLEMPGVHGIDVIKAALQVRPDLPVFVVTAYFDSPASDAALTAGGRCIIAKPVVYEKLRQQLEQCLARSVAPKPD